MQESVAQIFMEVRSAWRFRWYGAALAWVVSISGWTWVALQPNVYEASASVYVDTSSVLRPILNNQIVATDVATQLSYVRQKLLGREHLERVAAENHLDVGRSDSEREAVLAGLLQAIGIDMTVPMVPTSREQSVNSLYAIRYRHSQRDTAVSVVNTLLNSLIEDTYGANREGTDTAEQFLDARILEYENRLRQAEEALARFKRENADRLPGAEGSYFESLQEERRELDESQKQLRLAESKRELMVSQLNGESPVATTSGGLEPNPNSIDARIRDHRAELDRLLLDYTEKHPDVIGVRDALGRLEEQRAEQLRVLGIDDPDQELSNLDSNPVYQALRIGLNETDAEIATLRADIRERERKLADLQALIGEVPEVEAELARLNRDYAVVNEQYQGLTRSRETQDLSRKASDSDQLDFRVINPPMAAFNPVAPARLQLLLVIFVAALGVGGGVCYLLAQLKPVFGSVRALRELAGLPVLGAISHARVNEKRAQRRTALATFGLAMAGLAVLFAAAVTVEIAGPGIHSLFTGSA